MKWIKLAAAVSLSLLFAVGSALPVFAMGTVDDTTEEETIVDTFSTLWFDNHRNSNEFVIYTASQLQGLSYLVDEGHFDGFEANHHETFKGKTIKLGRDISMRDSFKPIGNSEDICFQGIFDGNGHTITLNISENGGYTGLFGYLGGTVTNLKLKGSVRSTGAECGAIAGYLGDTGVIRNCKTDVTVTGTAKTGGITGHNNKGTVVGCVNNGNVKGTIKIGGIVGENWGTVLKCGNRGTVESLKRGATTYGTGGICGRSVSSDASISKCFNTGTVISKTEGTGGICGYMNAKGSKILSCYNTGDIKVKNSSLLESDGIRGYAGGIVGIAGVKGLKIRNCYNTGSIDNSDISGGIIGDYLDESRFTEDPYISNNYYLNVTGIKGIGRDFEGNAKNIREGTEKIAPATLMSCAKKLGSAYMENAHAYYGADGFPVLKWQKKLGQHKKTHLSCLSSELQTKYDRYLTEHPKSKRAERPVMIFFNHSAFTSQAIGDFHEQKHKSITH